MKVREYFKSGDAWVWLNAGAVAISLIMVAGILGLIAVRGLGHFWPAAVMQAQYNDNGTLQTVIGEIYDEKIDTAQRLRESGVEIPDSMKTVTRYSIKQGNRDVTGQDFRWVLGHKFTQRQYPVDIVALERYEWGDFFGRLKAVKENGAVIADGDKAWAELQKRIDRSNDFHAQIKVIEKGEIGRINYQLEKLRLKERKLELAGQLTESARAELATLQQVQHQKYEALKGKLEQLNQAMSRDSAIFVVADGSEKELPLSKIVTAQKPNDMSVLAKLAA